MWRNHKTVTSEQYLSWSGWWDSVVAKLVIVIRKFSRMNTLISKYLGTGNFNRKIEENKPEELGISIIHFSKAIFSNTYFPKILFSNGHGSFQKIFSKSSYSKENVFRKVSITILRNVRWCESLIVSLALSRCSYTLRATCMTCTKYSLATSLAGTLALLVLQPRVDSSMILSIIWSWP